VTGPARTISDRQSAQLDRRRDQASAAATAAKKAQKGVTKLDSQLQTNASATRQQTRALRNAVAEVGQLKRALKTATKERDRLTKARAKAAARADKALATSRAAESKYDRSVLADLVRREKAKDRADTARPSVRNAGTAVTDSSSKRPGRGKKAAGRKTAARKTAARKSAARKSAGRDERSVIRHLHPSAADCAGAKSPCAPAGFRFTLFHVALSYERNRDLVLGPASVGRRRCCGHARAHGAGCPGPCLEQDQRA